MPAIERLGWVRRGLFSGTDLAYAARSSLRNPGFASAAIVTIALGVGVNTGIFTVLNGLLFREVPASDAHELVAIAPLVERAPNGVGVSDSGLVSTPEYLAYRDGTRTLALLPAVRASRVDPMHALRSE